MAWQNIENNQKKQKKQNNTVPPARDDENQAKQKLDKQQEQNKQIINEFLNNLHINVQNQSNTSSLSSPGAINNQQAQQFSAQNINNNGAPKELKTLLQFLSRKNDGVQGHEKLSQSVCKMCLHPFSQEELSPEAYRRHFLKSHWSSLDLEAVSSHEEMNELLKPISLEEAMNTIWTQQLSPKPELLSVALPFLVDLNEIIEPSEGSVLHTGHTLINISTKRCDLDQFLLLQLFFLGALLKEELFKFDSRDELDKWKLEAYEIETLLYELKQFTVIDEDYSVPGQSINCKQFFLRIAFRVLVPDAGLNREDGQEEMIAGQQEDDAAFTRKLMDKLLGLLLKAQQYISKYQNALEPLKKEPNIVVSLIALIKNFQKFAEMQDQREQLTIFKLSLKAHCARMGNLNYDHQQANLQSLLYPYFNKLAAKYRNCLFQEEIFMKSFKQGIQPQANDQFSRDLLSLQNLLEINVYSEAHIQSKFLQLPSAEEFWSCLHDFDRHQKTAVGEKSKTQLMEIIQKNGKKGQKQTESAGFTDTVIEETVEQKVVQRAKDGTVKISFRKKVTQKQEINLVSQSDANYQNRQSSRVQRNHDDEEAKVNRPAAAKGVQKTKISKKKQGKTLNASQQQTQNASEWQPAAGKKKKKSTVKKSQREVNEPKSKEGSKQKTFKEGLEHLVKEESSAIVLDFENIDDEIKKEANQDNDENSLPALPQLNLQYNKKLFESLQRYLYAPQQQSVDPSLTGKKKKATSSQRSPVYFFSVIQKRDYHSDSTTVCFASTLAIENGAQRTLSGQIKACTQMGLTNQHNARLSDFMKLIDDTHIITGHGMKGDFAKHKNSRSHLHNIMQRCNFALKAYISQETFGLALPEPDAPADLFANFMISSLKEDLLVCKKTSREQLSQKTISSLQSSFFVNEIDSTSDQSQEENRLYSLYQLGDNPSIILENAPLTSVVRKLSSLSSFNSSSAEGQNQNSASETQNLQQQSYLKKRTFNQFSGIAAGRGYKRQRAENNNQQNEENALFNQENGSQNFKRKLRNLGKKKKYNYQEVDDENEQFKMAIGDKNSNSGFELQSQSDEFQYNGQDYYQDQVHFQQNNQSQGPQGDQGEVINELLRAIDLFIENKIKEISKQSSSGNEVLQNVDEASQNTNVVLQLITMQSMCTSCKSRPHDTNCFNHPCRARYCKCCVLIMSCVHIVANAYFFCHEIRRTAKLNESDQEPIPKAFVTAPLLLCCKDCKVAWYPNDVQDFQKKFEQDQQHLDLKQKVQKESLNTFKMMVQNLDQEKQKEKQKEIRGFFLNRKRSSQKFLNLYGEINWEFKELEGALIVSANFGDQLKNYHYNNLLLFVQEHREFYHYQPLTMNHSSTPVESNLIELTSGDLQLLLWTRTQSKRQFKRLQAPPLVQKMQAEVMKNCMQFTGDSKKVGNSIQQKKKNQISALLTGSINKNREVKSSNNFTNLQLGQHKIGQQTVEKVIFDISEEKHDFGIYILDKKKKSIQCKFVDRKNKKKAFSVNIVQTFFEEYEEQKYVQRLGTLTCWSTKNGAMINIDSAQLLQECVQDLIDEYEKTKLDGVQGSNENVGTRLQFDGGSNGQTSPPNLQINEKSTFLSLQVSNNNNNEAQELIQFQQNEDGEQEGEQQSSSKKIDSKKEFHASIDEGQFF